ncbi:MAG TPA: VanZ family protein [Saprospiraceae bacterium]|nr:VanZ family protein [Saprospiraceae bacterium]HNT21937.1 VanZ family protein [Saprospiraceae bacterium]
MFFRKYLYSGIWILMILVLSLLPKSSLPEMEFDIPYLDKVVHFAMYFILLVLVSWERQKLESKPLFFNGLMLALLLSICTEAGQRFFFAGRSFEILDIVANIIGSISGIYFFRIILKPYK